MALAYLAPGVYVVEEDTGARPIEAVGTSTAGFVGEAPDPDAGHDGPIAVNSWAEFLSRFAPPLEGRNEPVPSTNLANAVQGFFLNGGSRCYIAALKEGQPIADKLAELGKIDEIAIIAAPGRTDIGSYNDLIASAQNLQDRVAVLDAPMKVDDVEQLTRTAESGAAAVAIAAPADKPATDKPAARSKRPGLAPPKNDKGSAALYYPWLIGRDAMAPMRFDEKTGRDVPNEVAIPPSGHIAGIYARTDGERGVHKAPANALILGATDLTSMLSQQEQEVLNPQGVNCIRFFSREGIRVWGARTIAPSASNWRYLNVRRLFNMIKESIANATRWVVFEPNDRPLWKLIERDVSAFLNLLWRQGALAGATPEEAYFVRCDASTNPQESIDAGNVVTVIGIAPVKPAEFVIFKIGQSTQGTAIATA